MVFSPVRNVLQRTNDLFHTKWTLYNSVILIQGAPVCFKLESHVAFNSVVVLLLSLVQLRFLSVLPCYENIINVELNYVNIIYTTWVQIKLRYVNTIM